MKYIKLYENTSVENRKKTLELKKKLSLLLVDYLNCFDLKSELYQNGRIGCKFKSNINGGVSLTKIGIVMEIEWSYNEYFADELDILIDWLKEKNISISMNTSRIKTYMNVRVNEIDEFMNALRELIDSNEIELRLNAKKYNV